MMEHMDGEREIIRERHKTFAKWIKEVAFLFLAALVVQNLVRGAVFSDTSVLIGLAVSLVAYAGAVYLMYQV